MIPYVVSFDSTYLNFFFLSLESLFRVLGNPVSRNGDSGDTWTLMGERSPYSWEVVLLAT